MTHTTKTIIDRKLPDGTTYWRYECTCGASESFLYKSNATKAGDAHQRLGQWVKDKVE